jgi:hypothetical protein
VESLLRLRQSLAAAAVIVLAACNAAQNASPTVTAGSSSRSTPARISFNHGSGFTAGYSGTFTRSGDCSATATYNYNGSGNARFLHASSERSKLTWFCGTAGATGSATLTSSRVRRDSITVSLSSKDFDGPCYSFTMSFTVTGGTGRFRNASGSGTIAVTKSSDCSYSYSDKWKGKLTF